jgi:uncharacterized protein (DUF486 family)
MPRTVRLPTLRAGRIFAVLRAVPLRVPGRNWPCTPRGDTSIAMPTILFLLVSNLFMTTAWYWHLKGGMNKPLSVVILISWGIAFVEYCFAVPANRVGYAHGWSAGQLKIVQEAIALIVFGGFMVLVLGEPLHWRHAAAFLCIMAAVAFLFVGR